MMEKGSVICYITNIIDSSSLTPYSYILVMLYAAATVLTRSEEHSHPYIILVIAG